MIITPFCRGDIPVFLRLAATEQWVAEPWEFEFLLTVFPEGCLCIRDGEGNGIAFVTSLRHERSGWIGNLIVAAGYRGLGIGERLFRAAAQALKDAGAGTIWLTASKMGKSLYEKQGFKTVDTINRWSGSGRQRHRRHGSAPDLPEAEESLFDSDVGAWGDRRRALVQMTVGRGRLIRQESGFAVVQPCGEAMQLGPFSALNSSGAATLLYEGLRAVPNGQRMYVDSPQSNRAAVRLFKRTGLRVIGTNDLMYAGVKPDYRPELLYGLATMGSCG